MPARGGDLQRPLGLALALDVAEVLGELAAADQRLIGHGAQRRDGQIAGQVAYRLQQGRRGKYLRALDAADLPGVLRGQQEALHAPLHHGDHHRQRAAHGPDAAVQRQLAEHAQAVQRLLVDHAHAAEYAQGDGQVEGGALLLQVRRGQVHDQPFRREAEAAVLHRRAHPFPGFLHRGVRQADDLKQHHAVGHVHFHFNGEALDAGKTAAGDIGKHVDTSVGSKKNFQFARSAYF